MHYLCAIIHDNVWPWWMDQYPPTAGQRRRAGAGLGFWPDTSACSEKTKTLARRSCTEQPLLCAGYCSTHHVTLILVRGTGHGPHEPLLDLVIGTVVAQGNTELHLVPHSSGLRRAACGAKRENKDDATISDGTYVPGAVLVDVCSLVTKGSGRRVCWWGIWAVLLARRTKAWSKHQLQGSDGGAVVPTPPKTATLVAMVLAAGWQEWNERDNHHANKRGQTGADSSITSESDHLLTSTKSVTWICWSL